MSKPQLLAESLQASLTVKNLNNSVTWYEQALGFAVDSRHEREGRLIAVALTADTVRILLTQDDGAKGLDRVKGEGFSLQLTIRQSVDDLAARIVAYGTNLETEPTTAPWGVRILRVRDPDGFRWTVSMPAAG